MKKIITFSFKLSLLRHIQLCDYLKICLYEGSETWGFKPHDPFFPQRQWWGLAEVLQTLVSSICRVHFQKEQF